MKQHHPVSPASRRKLWFLLIAATAIVGTVSWSTVEGFQRFQVVARPTSHSGFSSLTDLRALVPLEDGEKTKSKSLVWVKDPFPHFWALENDDDDVTPSTTEELREVSLEEDQTRDRQDLFFISMAIIPSIVAFLAWEDISHSLAVFLDQYGSAGRNVDGGQFTVNLLRPTITGVVVPVISIALATLVSTTINVLRERQVELRALINKEACELRLLRRALLGMYGTRQHASRRAKALALLCGYVDQLERECSVGAIQALEDLQLSGGIAVNELDLLAGMFHGVDGAAASRQGSVGVAEGLILSLNGHRSDRVALLLSTFPVIHWGVLIALSCSVCFTFLLNSNQQVLQYLNSVQLRFLFAILVGVFSGTATLCVNLADPFRGSFSIAEAATQLGDLQLCLKQDVIEATAEEGEISSKVVHALLLGGRNYSEVNGTDLITRINVSKELENELSENEEDAKVDELKRNNANDPTRYGLASTIYFHLLTGPLGSNARVLGDVIAWLATFIGKGTRAASNRIVSFSSAVKKAFWLPNRKRKNPYVKSKITTT